MNRILIFALVTLLLVLSGYIAYEKFIKSPPADEKEKIIKLMELKGSQKLILAEQEVYQEYEKNYGKIDPAVILIRWITKFEFIVDFQKQPVKITKRGNTFYAECPAIELNDPKIDVSMYKHLILRSSIFRNEDKYINDEQRTLLNRSKEYGAQLMNNPLIKKHSEEQMRLFLLSVASELGLKIENISISFLKQQAAATKLP